MNGAIFDIKEMAVHDGPGENMHLADTKHYRYQRKSFGDKGSN